MAKEKVSTTRKKTKTAAKKKKVTAKKKPTKAEAEVNKIIQMPSSGDYEDKAIRKLFKDSKLKRLSALFDEMMNGKGIARLQAIDRIAILEKEYSEEDRDVSVDMNWDVHVTKEAGSA